MVSGDMCPGSETVLQSATGVHMCPREGLGASAVTLEPSRRRPMALSLVQIRRNAGYVQGAVNRHYPTARLHQYGCIMNLMEATRPAMYLHPWNIPGRRMSGRIQGRVHGTLKIPCYDLKICVLTMNRWWYPRKHSGIPYGHDRGSPREIPGRN
jgi:hypothetical protein